MEGKTNTYRRFTRHAIQTKHQHSGEQKKGNGGEENGKKDLKRVAALSKVPRVGEVKVELDVQRS